MSFAGVAGRVIDGVGVPARPDHAEPGAGDDPNRVWMSDAALTCTRVEVLSPRRAVSCVVGEAGERDSSARVAGEPELHVA